MTAQSLGDRGRRDALAQYFGRRKQLKTLPFPPSQAPSDSHLLKPHSGKLVLSNLTRLLGPEEQTMQLVFLGCIFETLLVLRLGKRFQVKPSHGMTKPQARRPAAGAGAVLYPQELETLQKPPPAECGRNTKV